VTSTYEVPVYLLVAKSCLLSIEENFWFIIFTFTFVVASALLGTLYNRPDLVRFSIYSKPFYDMMFTATLIYLAIYLARITFFSNTKSLISRISSDIKNYAFDAYNITSILLVVVSFPLIVSSMTILKTLLPFMVPYYLDTFFMEWDKTLHFGAVPWEIIQPLVGYPYITFVINVIYNFWFFLQLFVFMWLMFSLNRPKLRMQFLTSYVLVWMLLGALLATLFASAGPCFYADITNLPDPYDPLFQYLNSANRLLAENNLSLWALDTQNYLWEHFINSTLGLGSGISAMPSLHVAIAVLLSLVGWRVNVRLGILFTIYAIMIFIGSVHLGWHYAVDGYASIIGVIVIWKLSGYLVRKLPEKRGTKAQGQS